jgi:hypothetical protein
MDLIERIGPALGIVAFLGLTILIFLLFIQSREIRRLREWAGRAPERAREAADASLTAAEARGESQPAVGGLEAPGRLANAWTSFSGAFGERWRALDRRLPVDARYILGVLLVAVVGAAVLTGGFGVIGGDEGGGRHAGGHEPKPSVAVLNGTTVSGIQGVPQLAAKIEAQVVEPKGYRSGPVTNTSSSFQATVVMFAPKHDAEARALATAVEPKLGQTGVQPMTQEVADLAGNAPLALVIGLDDSHFGSTSG